MVIPASCQVKLGAIPVIESSFVLFGGLSFSRSTQHMCDTANSATTNSLPSPRRDRPCCSEARAAPPGAPKEVLALP